MRSDLVFCATKQVSNRYLLARTLARAAREFHKPGRRIQDTTNEILIRFGWANPIAQGEAVPIAASLPTRRSSPLVANTHQSKRLKVPVVLESPHSQPEALQPSGN
jgi:hypothetical protein